MLIKFGVKNANGALDVCVPETVQTPVVVELADHEEGMVLVVIFSFKKETGG